jgi:NTE family protein
LCDAGEPIDFYGGTSVGAAMGAAMAMGLTPDQILDLTENMFVTNRAMQRLTIPMHSLLDHRVFDELLRANYAGTEIEDLPFNFFAVSSSLTTNNAHIHRRGPTWEAVRASTAIPGVLPPFITADGDVLVDGAMVDNMPIAVMRDMKIGPNLVVRLKRQRPWRIAARYDDFPTPRNVLRNLVFRRRERNYPSLATVLIRGMIMTSEQRLESVSTDGDLILTPKGTDRVGFLEWQKGRQVADAAYRHMADLLTDAGGLEALIDDTA